jgi:polyhydroxybutyrate depolymerase
LFAAGDGYPGPPRQGRDRAAPSWFNTLVRRPNTLWVLVLLLAGCSGEENAGPALDHGANPDQTTVDLSDGPRLLDHGTPIDGGPPATDSASPCAAPSLGPGSHTLTLQHDGIQRSYLLYVPKTLSPTTPTPLVLNFHGLAMNAALQVTFSGMNAAADSHKFVLAYPDGIQNSWNGGVCCGAAATQNVDDVGFARAVVADIQKRLCIDSKRVYAAGMSNGAILCYRLACEAADLFAAIGPVAGRLALLKACAPSRPVPIVHHHGTLDNVVQYSYGAATVAGWVQRNGCTDAEPAQTYSKGTASCEAYTQCKGGVRVEFCTITGGGHCWPGQPICPAPLGVSTTDISANEMIWNLFKQYKLP